MGKKNKQSLHPKTAREALSRWDAGELLFTVEMDGLGPSYEQAIHIGVFEIIRDNLGKRLPKNGKPLGDFGDKTLSRLDEKIGGFNGAMWCAARTLAARYLVFGYAKTLESVPAKRHIQISKKFPRIG